VPEGAETPQAAAMNKISAAKAVMPKILPVFFIVMFLIVLRSITG
jgi:uncharacterized membrane protein YtjA (UPF0391 family)